MEWWQIQELLMTSAVALAVLIPVCGLTYRFLVRPSRRERRELPGELDSSVEALRDARLDHMERQLEGMEAAIQRLVDVTEFDRQLKSGKPPEGSS
jgi:peptidoglycan/LPS O-acetylase OafA/YrhL